MERSSKRLLVISPHCDDAVFSCGNLITAHPGTLVVTVFAGRPAATLPLTEWDQAAGFQSGDDVMGIRRTEDQNALTGLQAEPRWLDFCDSQYRCSPSVGEVSVALQEIIQRVRPQAIFLPLGLFHSDHQLTHEAACLLLKHDPAYAWFVYADALYRCIPGLLNEKLHVCTQAGLRLVSVEVNVSDDHERKRQAVGCYRSQLRALTTSGRPGYQDAFAPEKYWRVGFKGDSLG